MAFSLNNESISYNDQIILHSLSFNIKRGESVALLGKSGSGKSTLIKKLYESRKEESSYIPQELSLVENLSVYNNIYVAKLDEFSTIHNLINLVKPAKKDVDSVTSIIKQLELEDKLLQKVHDLSGGQKQRVAISRAIYEDKSILLADEPISALDEYLSSIVTRTLKKNFETIVCALHNVEVATKNFERVIGLKNSKIIIDKKCSDLNADDIQKLYYVCE
ncbi:ATP-binding cassette domain-containing protein [Sulfurimonas sp.]|uniref:ATP-binding cassette domain-containing protein n=1 Tax=Sulfurimonas sp. TaxID=2022749 RepID=UPI0025ED14DC|nr:ATP-binding cassette domain-containing protein [Sulfurimonas sp.]